MSPPRSDPWQPELERLLRFERQRPPPVPQRVAGLRAQLEQQIALPIRPSVSVTARLPPLPASATFAPWSLGLASVGGVALLGGLWLRSGPGVEDGAAVRGPPPAVTRTAGLPAIGVSTGPNTVAAVAPVPLPTRTVARHLPVAGGPGRSSSPAHGFAPQPVAVRGRSLADEQVLLQTAASALGRSDPELALQWTERHAQQFPEGQLAEQRDYLIVKSLRSLGRIQEAQQLAVRFSGRFPNSSLLLPQ